MFPFIQLKLSVYGLTYADRQTYTRVLQCSHASVGLAQARPNDSIKIFMITTDSWSINCVDWYSGTLKGLRTKTNTEEWHSKLQKLAGKAHPIYKAVTPFQSEHAVTEISLMQLTARRLPKRRINTETMGKDLLLLTKNMRQATTPSVNYLRPICSHWVEYLQVTKSFLNENKRM